MTTTTPETSIALAVLAEIERQYGDVDVVDRGLFVCDFDEDDDDQTIETPVGEFRIMTESGLDSAWDEALDSYLDDCVLPELPEVARMYFDEDAWKRDARFDGWAHTLGHYDGIGLECHVPGFGWRHLVRVN